jgi:hypothetical protein
LTSSERDDHGIDLGLFSAQSVYGTPTLVSYSSRGIANSGPQVGTIAEGPVHGNSMQSWNMGGNVVWICLFGVVLIIALALIFRGRK